MIRFSARTHVGSRGGENEDHIGWMAEGSRFVVADGMGGRPNGARASEIVCEAVVGVGAARRLDRAVLAAHAAILAASTADPALGEMGSTAVAAEFRGQSCQIVWVGDSRAYLWRDGVLVRLTRDHSFVEQFRRQDGRAEHGSGEPADGHVLMQFLGDRNEPTPSVLTQRVDWHDVILLCSDGLTAELDDAAIADALRDCESTDEAADSLISATLVAGARDNVSVVVIDGGKEPRGLAAIWNRLVR